MKINIGDKFKEISEFWHPYTIGELNNNFIKLAKIKGKYIWHKHQDEDEMLMVITGVLLMDFRNGRMVKTLPGEILIIPKGVEHLPRTFDEEEVLVMMIESKKMVI